MRNKPVYSAQGFFATQREFERWLNACRNEAHEKGAVWVRVYKYPHDDNLVLIEAWRHKPKKSTKPRFQFH